MSHYQALMALAIAIGLMLGCGTPREDAKVNASQPVQTTSRELVVCNGDKRDVFVFLYNTMYSPEKNAEWLQPASAIWHWHPLTSDLPAEMRDRFRGVDECKPVMGLDYLLVTSSWSGGGMALIRRSDKKALYCAASVSNAHSAEVLPDGNIVAASSGANGFLRIFKVDRAALRAGELQPEQPVGADVPLPYAHGVVWDKARACLWALGNAEIVQLTYRADALAPALTVVSRTALPEGGGHDLFPMLGGKDALMVSTHAKTWLFTPAERTFTEFKRLPLGDVKSMCRLAKEDLLVAVAAERDNAAAGLVFSDADGNQTRVAVPGATFYKARWCVLNDFSY